MGLGPKKPSKSKLVEAGSSPMLQYEDAATEPKPKKAKPTAHTSPVRPAEPKKEPKEGAKAPLNGWDGQITIETDSSSEDGGLFMSCLPSCRGRDRRRAGEHDAGPAGGALLAAPAHRRPLPTPAVRHAAADAAGECAVLSFA